MLCYAMLHRYGSDIKKWVKQRYTGAAHISEALSGTRDLTRMRTLGRSMWRRNVR